MGNGRAGGGGSGLSGGGGESGTGGDIVVEGMNWLSLSLWCFGGRDGQNQGSVPSFQLSATS